MINHILVTGGTGYLGSNIIKALNAQGYLISVLIRKESSLKRLEPIISDLTFVFFEELDSFFKVNKINGIIHLATNYGRNNEPLNDLINSNLILPINLFQLAIDYKIDFFINTDTSLPRNLNYYSLSKAQFKDWLKNISFSLKVVNIIPEYFYGPTDDKTKFISGMLDKLQKQVDSIDLSEGTQQRDFIYIEDMVSAYICVIKNLDSLDYYTDISVGSSTTITLRNLVELIKKMSDNTKTILNFGKLPIRKGDVMESKADISFLKSLGWEPRISLEEGINIIIKEDYKGSYQE